MNIFDKSVYTRRRNSLKKLIGKGQLLFLGNNESPINYKDNCYWFRQDSSFLYFFGLNQPKLLALIDIDKDEEIIFGEENTIDTLIWEGKSQKLADACALVGIHKVESIKNLSKYLNNNVQYLPPYRGENTLFLCQILNKKENELLASDLFIKSVIKLRSIKEDIELLEMENALNITKAMHEAAMKFQKEDKYEYEVVGEIMKQVYGNNTHLSYPVIFTTQGQILHNHEHNLLMEKGKLALNDSGAQSLMAYAADITRTFPVSKKFSERQKNIYELVLAIEEGAIGKIAPGVPYLNIHKNAIQNLLEGLKSFGIFKGDSFEAMELGVGGLFMPHGLGHMIGLDVHDMEDLGEDLVGYEAGQKRSSQLGLKSLRLAKPLEEGFVLTVEPGIYFIPELINLWRSEKKFDQFINYEELEKWKDFGGVRIEDNVYVTNSGSKVLGNPIPKSIKEIENING